MRGESRSAASDGRRAYQPPRPKIMGVRKFREFTYEGWKVAVFRRDQGIAMRRIAYSARVTEIGTNNSFYIPPADDQRRVINAVKKRIELTSDRGRREQSKFYTFERVLNLWFRSLEDGDSLPPTMDSTYMPE